MLQTRPETHTQNILPNNHRTHTIVKDTGNIFQGRPCIRPQHGSQHILNDSSDHMERNYKSITEEKL